VFAIGNGKYLTIRFIASSIVLDKVAAMHFDYSWNWNRTDKKLRESFSFFLLLLFG
jgi:hypothetical protein